MSKAYSVLQVKSYEDDGESRTITGIASTPSVDRDSDIIDAKGVKFALPIPLLWQHNHNQPIGEVISASVTDDGVEFTAKIAKIDEEGTLKNRIDEAWQSIKSGLVKCVSVGFRALEYDYLENSYGLHIKNWEWYELSVVTIPANPDAMITSVKQIKDAFDDAAKGLAPKPKAVAETQPDPETTFNEPVGVDNTGSTIALIDPNVGSVKLIEPET